MARRVAVKKKPQIKNGTSRKADYVAEVVATPPAKPLKETISVELDANVVETLQHLSVKRGVDLSTLIRVAMCNLAQKQTYYTLETPLTFGQYRGEKLETVIRCNPDYVAWILQKFDNLELSESALVLLKEILLVGRPA